MPAAHPARFTRWRLHAIASAIALAPVLSAPGRIDPSPNLAPPAAHAVELLRDEPAAAAAASPSEDLDALDSIPPELSVAAVPARARLPATEPASATPGPPPFLRGLYTGSARTSIESRGRSHVVWMEVTAYCPCPICCGSRAQGITASGKSVTADGGFFVAADADRFDFGATVRIPGYHDGQIVEVLDRGSAILGPRLDVFFPTHEQAAAWGRQWLPVTVEGE